MRKSLLLLAVLLTAPAAFAQNALQAMPPGAPIDSTPVNSLVAITQNTSTTPTQGGVACATTATGLTRDNSYYRRFALASHGVTTPVQISSVNAGLFVSFTNGTATSVPGIVMNLYRQTGAAFPGGTRVLAGTASIPAQVATPTAGSMVTFTFSPAPVFLSTETLVVEMSIPDGNATGSTATYNARSGENTAGQSGPTYIASPVGCAISTPTDLAGLGFPTNAWVVVVNADNVVANEGAAQNSRISLGSAVPNPTLGSATIPFEVRQASDVRLSVYDALGREVAVLANGAYAVGQHTATFTPNGLPAGAYVYRLVADGEVLTSRLTVTH
ncbi:MAG TPA: T9SS type A sorting domain-containing protein [Rhodothermales bacterium]|nr:T9SS type A sorting domain-containing protein [Rhodothermales bacterium]